MEPSNGPMEQTEAVDVHQTHSFEWCRSGKRPTSVTCNKAGTVVDALKRSSQFRRTAENMKGKELVIVRNGKAIASHFPCSLIRKERITLKYVKPVVKKQKTGNASVLPRRKGPSSELITFNILTKGGKNVSKILINPAISAHVQEITVYAYKGEKVRDALRRDGRILMSVLKRNCALSHVSTEVNTEMSNLVDDLDGQTYRIKLLNKFPLPESQLSSSLEDDYVAPNISKTPDCDENPDPQQSAKTKSGNDSTAKETMLHQMANELRLQLKQSLKGRKTVVSELSRIQNLFRVEYRKCDQTFKEVHTLMKLTGLSRYVCQVRIDGRPKGTGFLLFDRFVLTNAHVLKDICNSRCQLDLRVTVHFAYNSLDQTEGVQESQAEITVKDVAGIEYSADASGHKYDWALLRLSSDHKFRDGLLPRFGFLPSSGEICIIGHPDGGVKKIDTCLIIQPQDRIQVMEPYLQFITPLFFDDMSEFVQRKDALTYEPCFFYGSSGSPVFDKYCRVVAMHSGGFRMYCQDGTESSLIDFGYPLSSIIEHIIVQMVQNGKLDVLEAFLACEYTHHQDMMINVKKIVESRNITAFRDARHTLESGSSESLRKFFDFICLKEEPVPMDADYVLNTKY